jgi:hypothetical protein
MVVVDRAKEIMSLEFRGKLGKPTGLGAEWLGWNEIGDEQTMVGYFQKRRGGIWETYLANGRVGFIEIGANELGGDTYYKKLSKRKPQKIVLLKHYWPDNFLRNAFVGTLSLGVGVLGEDYFAEISWQQVFANGVASWHDLTTLQKLYYNRLRYPTGQSGFTRYMSKYLGEHQT